jgi:hypothetical protein
MLWKEKNGRVFEHAAVTDPTLFTKISDEIELSLPEERPLP